MGRATIIVENELLDRLIDPEGPFARRVWVIQTAKWCDRTQIAKVETPILRDGYHGMMSIVIADDGGIRFKDDSDV